MEDIRQKFLESKDKYLDLVRVCPKRKKESFISVLKENYLKWEEGEYIQCAFPDLDPEQREIIKTGICGTCWDKMFNFPEEEEED